MSRFVRSQWLILTGIVTTAASSQAQVWNSVPLAPPDSYVFTSPRTSVPILSHLHSSIFALTARYVADTNPKKINLGVGAYRDDNGKPWVLPVVKKASLSVARYP